MSMKKTFCILAILLGAGLFTGAGLDTAAAQASKKDVATKNDKSLATKEGVEGSLGQMKIDSERLPGTLEIGMAIGSTIAMVAALKWL